MTRRFKWRPGAREREAFSVRALARFRPRTDGGGGGDGAGVFLPLHQRLQPCGIPTYSEYGSTVSVPERVVEGLSLSLSLSRDLGGRGRTVQELVGSEFSI